MTDSPNEYNNICKTVDVKTAAPNNCSTSQLSPASHLLDTTSNLMGPPNLHGNNNGNRQNNDATGNNNNNNNNILPYGDDSLNRQNNNTTSLPMSQNATGNHATSPTSTSNQAYR